MKNLSLVFIALILIWAGIVLGLLRHGGVFPFDLVFSQFLQAHQPQWLLIFNLFVSGFDFFLLPLAFFLFLLNRKKHFLEAVLILLSGFSFLLVFLMKKGFNLPCPAPPAVKLLFSFARPRTACYPSGHVFDYVVFFGLLICLRRKIFQSIWIQQVVLGLGLFLITLVGISRIFLGAHWLTDVLGGYFFGLGWLLILCFFKKLKN